MILAENPACNPLCRVCHYKDLDYPSQLGRKQAWAASQLGKWGHALREIVPAPEGERIAYRAKSWMKGAMSEDGLSFGMYRSVRAAGKWEKEFVSWDSCPLHVVPIQDTVARLREALAREAPRFSRESLVGAWLASPHLVIVSRHPSSAELKRMDWPRLLAAPFNRVWFHHNPQVGRKIFGHHGIEPVYGEPGPVDAAHPIRAFRQIAQSLLVEARSLALRHLLQSKPDLLVDLYCGAGDLSLLLPRETGWLGIEMSKEAVLHASALRPEGDAPHAAFVGAVEQRLRDPRVLERIRGKYALYVNPPRSGLTAEASSRVLALMRERPPASVAYLSCSASSLARDLRAFEAEGYRASLLQPYDFFPQTEHFETLAVLSPGG